MERILIIDDDTELCELLLEYLQSEGFDITAVYDGKGGLERALSETYGLIVLDVMLPGMNGFEVLQRIRSRSAVPVLMLTARGEAIDRIVGLEMGADDYLPKPFNPRELVARIRAVLRRTRHVIDETTELLPPDRIIVGDIDLNRSTRIVHRNEEPIELTSVEFSLLEMLLQYAGRVVSREELAEGVLGRTLGAYDRSIDVHISSLRKKLGHQVDGMERIRTVRGAGYLYTRSPQNVGDEADSE